MAFASCAELASASDRHSNQSMIGARNSLVSMVKYVEPFALQAQSEPVKRQIENRCCIEGQQLTDDEASDNADS